MSDSGSSHPAARESHQRLLGLLTRKERWGPSWRGWLVLLLLATLSGWLATLKIYSFLAPTSRVHAKILVVEGWVSAQTLRQAIKEFRTGGYREVITSGCLTYEDSGWRTGSTYADWAAQRLQRYGLTDAPITPVPCYEENRDRTFHSALAVRSWLERNRPAITAVDLLTTGPHARRSWLLFQKALGPDITVGIISVPDPQYDHYHWWRSSEGVREVLGETIAYIYARFFFWPRTPRRSQSP
jgi:hypothetical protein